MTTTLERKTPRRIAVRPTPYKRSFDLAILVVSHIVLLPVWLLLWTLIPLFIKLDDRGPVLFKQARVGKDGRIFHVYKFRTMTVDAESTGPDWTSDEDPRVTRVGRILRSTALDEIPQLISIWKGDMSFVGPRPLVVSMHEDYVSEEPDFNLRLLAQPGLTGLSAVYLPRHCSPLMRLQWDLAYIQQASLLLDLKVFVISVWLTLTGKWGKGARRVAAAQTQDSSTFPSPGSSS
ncbi:MAG: sugar transferase [Dehalococcoidia bacterium]